MNKEIKFRLWDKENKRMLYYDNDIVPNMTLNGVLVDDNNSNVSYKYDIMQSTGLRDKNGVEIYKGDIVKTSEHYPLINESIIVEVIFNRGSYCLATGTIPSTLIPEMCEVIGSIYENKELVN